MESIEITTNKPYWVLFSVTTTVGWSGRDARHEKHIFQFDTAKEMDEFIANETVTAGESEGTYYFKIHAMSHTWDRFQEEVLSDKYMEEESKAFDERLKFCDENEDAINEPEDD